ncbi:hypothetical protein NEDG_02180 [Nematocida displodere]|uniref:Uncharacterized protein n=1 Tax=Nematocida displodere TaxID=1805483 RepID=A0A177EL29_9MICR|nr:hypothetical protein NEDG_02180 [Nematocida displodere]
MCPVCMYLFEDDLDNGSALPADSPTYFCILDEAQHMICSKCLPQLLKVCVSSGHKLTWPICRVPLYSPMTKYFIRQEGDRYALYVSQCSLDVAVVPPFEKIHLSI